MVKWRGGDAGFGLLPTPAIPHPEPEGILARTIAHRTIGGHVVPGGTGLYRGVTPWVHVVHPGSTYAASRNSRLPPWLGGKAPIRATLPSHPTPPTYRLCASKHARNILNSVTFR